MIFIIIIIIVIIVITNSMINNVDRHRGQPEDPEPEVVELGRVHHLRHKTT